MPEDAKFPFEYDETGDISTVDDEDFYYQHAQQLVLLATDEIKGESLTQADIVDIQDTIGREIISSPFFSPPVSVSIESTVDEELVAEVIIQNPVEVEVIV